MPELPEVEVVRRHIEPWLLQRKISRVRTTPASYFFLTPPAKLARRLQGRSVNTLTRHGKYLIANLDDGSRLVLHLGMTGQLFVECARSSRSVAAVKHAPHKSQPSERDVSSGSRPQADLHTHLQIEFADAGPKVFFRDVRKFGKALWLAPKETDSRITRLGVDALQITAEVLQAATYARSTAIKSLLLDQTVLAGVGNIYADEALFAARINPRRAAKSLTQAECRKLAKAIRRVLECALRRGGSSIRDYVHPDGEGGRYQTQHKVYRRQGKPCRRCQTPIRRVVLGQRSTHFCPLCQI